MLRCFLFACLALSASISDISAQKLKKKDKVILANLESEISYLADDKLEGRRAGTPGEKLVVGIVQ